MNKNWEKEWKETLNANLETVDLPEAEEKLILQEIHQKLDKRRTTMKLSKKKAVVIIAAAIAAVGTISAVAAGKIVGYSSSTDVRSAIHSTAELEKQATKSLNATVHIPSSFSNGDRFKEGFVSAVDAWDEEGNKVTSYPQADAYYGEKRQLTLSVERRPPSVPEDEKAPQHQEVYRGITLNARQDAFLFLSSEAEPSEEDKKKEAAGELYISYGTDTEKREIFQSVSWSNGGIDYLLSTFADTDADTLMKLAKEVVDAMDVK